MPKQNIEAVNISAMTAEQRDAALALDVERLLLFGRKHKLIKELDAIVARNTLLDLLGLAQPSEENVPKEDFDTPAALLYGRSEERTPRGCVPFLLRRPGFPRPAAAPSYLTFGALRMRTAETFCPQCFAVRLFFSIFACYCAY